MFGRKKKPTPSIEGLVARLPLHPSPVAVTEHDIAAAARDLSVVWPASYIRFLLALNNHEVDFVNLYRVLPFSNAPSEAADLCIRTAQPQLRADLKLPPWMLVFYADGTGDYEGFDLRGKPGAYPIVSWSHEVAWDEDCDDPLDAISQSESSFDDWLVNFVDTIAG